MANVKAAVDFTIKQEDQKLEGKITDSIADRGGRTRWGLAQRWHTELTASGFFTTMGRDESFALAETTYEKVYSGPLFLASINSQVIATALLSFSVLEGNFEAVTLLQRSMMSLGIRVTVDGKCGPATVAAVNSADPSQLIPRLVAFQKAYFAQIARNQPSQAGWVAGWGNRADAIQALLTAPPVPAARLPVVAAVAPAAPVSIPDAQESPAEA